MLQDGSCDKTLSFGVDPHDESLLMDNTGISVFMPTRRHRQVLSEDNNELSNQPIQINKLDVECELDANRVLVTIEFLQPFSGIIYSKGYKEDPSCK